MPGINTVRFYIVYPCAVSAPNDITIYDQANRAMCNSTLHLTDMLQPFTPSVGRTSLRLRLVDSGAAAVHIGADFQFEVAGQSSVGLIGGGRGQWLGGGIMASAEHEPIMGVWGRARGQGVRGRSRPEAENILVTGCPSEPANLAPLVKFSK